MANIMIMGDSWALGEWHDDRGPAGYRVMHLGTEQYLREAGHRVCSVAEASSSNWAQVDRMSPHHAYQRDRECPHSAHLTDVIIWFLTDPLRDHTSLGSQLPTTRAEYSTQPDQLMRARLTDMARLYPDRRILLIGGVQPVPTWVGQEFPQFAVVVQSLLHWLIPSAHQDLLPTLCRTWQYPDCDPDLLDHWEQVEQIRDSHLWRAQHRIHAPEHQWFWPDGLHPNRAAHQRLSEELILPHLAG